jgi:hypothetical protein
MDARGIETLGEFALMIKRAGYGRGINQSVVSQWMAGSTRQWNIPRFCYYLDRALDLTPAEKAAVAAAEGLSEYPVPPSRPSEERRVFWSSSTLAHHGKLL